MTIPRKLFRSFIPLDKARIQPTAVFVDGPANSSYAYALYITATAKTAILKSDNFVSRFFCATKNIVLNTFTSEEYGRLGYITPCSSEIARCFGETYRPHLQGQRITQASGLFLTVSCLGYSTLRMYATCSSETSGSLPATRRF
jgi:hypothetical protein